MRVRKNVNITEQTLKEYGEYLWDEERGGATVEKYVRDVREFLAFLPEDKEIGKEMVREYKEWLREWYKITSANSMLAAVNNFFIFLGKEEPKVRPCKIQRMTYSRSKRKIAGKDCVGLVKATRVDEDERMSILFQTIGDMGIRISELKFIAVDAVDTGRAEIYNKGKSRAVPLPVELARLLKTYCRKARIGTGGIFAMRNGEPMDRSNISKRIKRLSIEAGADVAKVFPHNLRHLLARISYSIEEDVVRLMDLLRHSNINTTKIYTATTEERPRRRMAQMRLVLG